MNASGSIFKHLGVKPVINASGVYTDLGGSRLSNEVWLAMAQMNECFVDLPELIEAAGSRIADLLGAESALVTPGSAAAIMLGTAACLAGTDGEISQRLPHATGMRSKVLIQSGQRYKYDRQAAMTGARLVEVGSQNGTRADQLEEAIDADTAMFLYPAHLEGKAGSLAIEEVCAIAHRRGVAVFVDAAYMNYPTELMSSFIPRGADLVTFSAKYFGGPNAGGFIMGRRDLIDAVSMVNFTRYESGAYLKYGRPLKMDRQIVAAVVVALEEWLALDHEERLRAYAHRASILHAGLKGVPGLTLAPKFFTMDERLVPEPVNCLVVGFDGSTAMTARELCDALAAGDPKVLAVLEGDKVLLVVDVMSEAEASRAAERIREIVGQEARA